MINNPFLFQSGDGPAVWPAAQPARPPARGPLTGRLQRPLHTLQRLGARQALRGRPLMADHSGMGPVHSKLKTFLEQQLYEGQNEKST